MLNKKTLMAGASAVAIFAAQAVVSGEAQAFGGDPSSPWNGFYMGAHVGAAQNNWDGVYDITSTEDAVFFEDLQKTGITAGLQIGYNMMMGRYLLGIEGDWSWMDLHAVAEAVSDTEQATSNVDSLASIRGRLGVAVDEGQRALLYATAGFAWADADATFYSSGRASDTQVSFDYDDVGGVVGGGVEWAASQSIRIRAEGLYYWFDDKADLFEVCNADNNGPCSGANPGDNIEYEDVYTFRVGASYYFNAPEQVHHAMK
jgi:outer membrane immunogenic protein